MLATKRNSQIYGGYHIIIAFRGLDTKKQFEQYVVTKAVRNIGLTFSRLTYKTTRKKPNIVLLRDKIDRNNY